MSKVILKNLVKSYDGKNNIIDNINLEIRDKEFIILVGSSGCGKSTILRLISGLEDITSGDILIDDKIVNNVHPKDRDIAFVFQSYALYPHMSVYDNIAFGLKMRKYDKEVINTKVIEVAKALGLENLLDRKPKQLSGGQSQRVALGRAIVRNPKVFLMDEPLSNLDANLRVKMRSEIKKLHNKLKTTFIYVTHDQTEALTMGDRIVILDKGQIQQIDTPENIYNNPKNKFVAGFIGQMNFIDIIIKDKKFCIENKTIEIDKNLTGNYILGIRQEKMTEGDIEIKVTPEIVEMTGSDKIVYFKLNNCECSAKISSNTIFNEKTLNLYLSKSNMYFFDNFGERV